MSISGTDFAAHRAHRSQETERLFREAAGEEDAARRDELISQAIELNISVAHAVARRYRGRHIALDDLEQVACTALIRAAKKFDPESGNDFLTYAVPTMSGELKRHFRDHGWTIRPPRRLQEIQSKVIRAWTDAEYADAQPSAAKIAAQLNLAEPDVAEALTMNGCFTPASLDAPLTTAHNGDSTLAAQLDSGDDPASGALEARLLVYPALRTLKERDRRIVYMRFFEDKTQSEIGEELGVTQMQTSRLLKRILDQLRDQLTDEPSLASAS